MRIIVALSALLLAGLALSACSTSPDMGVLPRDPVPPPPTIGGPAPRGAAINSTAPAQRRTLSVPSRT